MGATRCQQSGCLKHYRSSGLVVLAIAGMLGAAVRVPAATNLSAWAYPGSNGRILQQPDALGNRLLDYSMVGYKSGTVPLPDVGVKTNLAPIAGIDNGPRIQSAINYVSALPLVNGFRGAVLLSAGEYLISNSVTISASGVVLRGAGDGTNGTILRAAGPRPTASVSADHAPLIVISGSGSAATSGTARNITNNYVPVGARSFNVDNISGLAVGGRVMVTRPSPANWITDIGMDLVSPAWTAGGFNVPSERFITRIEGNRIILDAPLTCALEVKYGGGTIQPYSWSGRITNVGVEDLRGISDFDPTVTTNTGATSYYYADELHALDFINADTVEDAWVRRVTSQYFGYGCVHLSSGSRNVTVRDCTSLDPVSIITGERRYAFALADARNCLVQNCYTRNDRHQFVTDSLNTGPNVFVDGLSDNAFSDAGPHFRWGTGAIWDSVTVNGDYIDVRNRGNAGTSHGWAGANEVVWNSQADGFIVESPATARNWLIGSIGPLGVNTLAVGLHPDGTYDSRNTNVFPNSLYYAQLQDRLAAPSLQTREYWVGEINQFATASSTGTVVTVDAAWRSQVQTFAAGAAVNGFDIVTNNQFVPFTFNYTLGATDRVVAASLALALRAFTPSTNEVLYLDSTNNAFTFAQLNWSPIGTNTNTTVRVLDLGDQLSLLNDGRFNLALSDDVGVDWAMLELQVAPVQTSVTNSIPPAADAFVRGGVSANLNFGGSATLDVKADSSADNVRQAYLRWNLAGYSSRLQQARLRLTAVSVGTNGLEHGLTVARSNDWDATTLTWNTQPGGGKRFATWIPGTNGTVELIVTPQVQDVLDGDGQLSFEMFSLKNVGGPGLVSYAASEDGNPARRPQLLLVYSNALPGISAINSLTIPASANTGPLSFTIGDPVTAANLLTLGAVSSNPALVPVSGFTFGGSLSNRTVTVTPTAGQIGTALITVIVTNSAGLTVGSQFTLSVTNPLNSNTIPVIAPIPDRGVTVNTSTAPIPITVGDPFYDANILTLGAASANPTLITTAGLVLGGAGSNRTLSITPTLSQTGTALITVTVTNPASATATATFTLSVTNLPGTATASGSWILDASGDWNNSANWSSGIVANGLDATAAFVLDATGARYVNNGSARTIGNLVFSDTGGATAGSWFVTNSPLTLQFSAGTPAINVTNTTATLTTTVNGTQGFSKAGDGTLVLTAANGFSGSVSVNGGALRVAHNTALGLTAAGTSLFNDPTARLELSGGITVAEPITIQCKGSANGNVPAVLNFSGTNTLAGTLTLTTGGSFWTFEAASGRLRITGPTTNSTTTNVRTIWLRGGADGEWLSAIGDSAGALGTALRKDDTGTWTLAGTNTYSGGTVVSNGTLLVNGLVGGSSFSVAGGVLGGTGMIRAPVTLNSGATLAPGPSLGTLTISNNLTLAAGATTVIELNAQSLTNDLVRGVSNLVYAGTLQVTNLAGSLLGGQSYKLFSATTASGNFSAVVPPSPGPNLTWSFDPAAGTLNIVSLPPPYISNATLSGSGFALSGTGPSGQGYRVLMATNLEVPLGNWFSVATGVFSGGVFNALDGQATNSSGRFYRVVTP